MSRGGRRSPRAAEAGPCRLSGLTRVGRTIPAVAVPNARPAASRPGHPVLPADGQSTSFTSGGGGSPAISVRSLIINILQDTARTSHGPCWWGMRYILQLREEMDVNGRLWSASPSALPWGTDLPARPVPETRAMNSPQWLRVLGSAGGAEAVGRGVSRGDPGQVRLAGHAVGGRIPPPCLLSRCARTGCPAVPSPASG